MPNVNSEIWWLAGWGSSPDLSDTGTGTLTFGTLGSEALTDRGAAGLSLTVDGREVQVETGAGTLVLTPTGTGEVTGEPTPPPAPRHVLTPSGPVDVGPEYIYVPARPQPPRRVVTRQSLRVPAAPRRVKVIIAERSGAERRRDEDELLLMGLL